MEECIYISNMSMWEGYSGGGGNGVRRFQYDLMGEEKSEIR